MRVNGAPMTRVNIEIPPARASQIAEVFEDEGLSVEWEAPMEKRAGIEHELVQVVFYLKDQAGGGVVGGTAYAMAQAGMGKIRKKFPSVGAKIEDDGE